MMGTMHLLRPARFPARSALLLAFAFAFALVLPVDAHAHSAQFQSMAPPDGATISAADTYVVIAFTDAVQFHDLEVRMPDGRVERPELQVGARNVTEFVVPPITRPGPMVVTWSVPQSDGHMVDYERSFVLADSAVDPRARAVHDAMAELLDALRAAVI